VTSAKTSDNKFAKETKEKPEDGDVILDRPDVDQIEFSNNGIENFNDFDPFGGEGEEIETRNIIHIRIQQRNGRKTLTTVQGLPEQFDQRKILKVIKKKFACNGTTVVDKELGEVIQLQGDQRRDILEFLTDSDEGLDLDERDIKVHGF
jgi:translation initiation factor 1